MRNAILAAAILLTATAGCTMQTARTNANAAYFDRSASGVACENLSMQQARLMNGQRYGCFDIPTPRERAQENPGGPATNP